MYINKNCKLWSQNLYTWPPSPKKKIIYKLTHGSQIEKISDLPFYPDVPKVTQKNQSNKSQI